MVKILPLSKRLVLYLTKRNLGRTFSKQKKLFENNPFHTGLNTEILEPHHLNIHSFRITRKYRAVFIYRGNSQIEIVDINNHYN